MKKFLYSDWFRAVESSLLLIEFTPDGAKVLWICGNVIGGEAVSSLMICQERGLAEG